MIIKLLAVRMLQQPFENTANLAWKTCNFFILVPKILSNLGSNTKALGSIWFGVKMELKWFQSWTELEPKWEKFK